MVIVMNLQLFLGICLTLATAAGVATRPVATALSHNHAGYRLVTLPATHAWEHKSVEGAAAHAGDADNTETIDHRAAQRLQEALDIAIQVIASYCDIGHYRAHVSYTSLEPTVLMHAYSPQINVSTNVAPGLSWVYIPVFLARRLLNDMKTPHGGAWSSTHPWNATHVEIKFDPAVQDANWIIENTQYDVFITLNVHAAFGIFDSDCYAIHTDEGLYSVISVFIHELLHGMGIQSHVQANVGGGLSGGAGVSLYDSLMKYNLGAQQPRVFPDDHTVRQTTAEALAGREIYIGNTRLFNPPTHQPGSSLHHVHDTDAVMSSALVSNKCKFSLTASELDVLAHLGWRCSAAPQNVTWDVNNSYLELLGLAASDGHMPSPHGHHHPHHPHHCECYDGHECVPCGWATGIVFYLTLALLSVCITACFCLGPNVCGVFDICDYGQHRPCNNLRKVAGSNTTTVGPHALPRKTDSLSKVQDTNKDEIQGSAIERLHADIVDVSALAYQPFIIQHSEGV